MSGHKHWNYETVDLVTTALKSIVASNPNLSLIESERVIFNRKEIFDPKKKVIVLSGGGSGHEPLHAGFVGKNFLDAAVAGAIFASPSTKQILSAIVTINDLVKERNLPEKEFLVIVKNYTGDVLHFGLAAERAKSLGFKVELAIVEDDVSVGKSKGHLVGRRGLAGTALVHKVAGTVAASGADLKQVSEAAHNVIKNLVTVGASLDHCSIPGRKISKEEEDEEASNKLDSDTVEIGMGIHNEPGAKRTKIAPVDKFISELLKYLLDESDEDRGFLKFDKSDESILLVNNLGGTSNLELHALAAVAIDKLAEEYNIKPVRVYVGSFVTSLNGNGFSLTLLNTTKAGGDKILEYLDSETDASGWNSSVQWVKALKDASDNKVPAVISKPTADVTKSGDSVNSNFKIDTALLKAILQSAIERITKLEPKITEYDTVAGDGDCGETLLSGCKAITNSLKDSNSILSRNLSDPVAAIFEVANLLEDSMGGTSGGLYSIFMSSLAVSLKTAAAKSSEKSLSVKVLADSLQNALESLFKYTRARTGDKTLIDALEPFIESLLKNNDLKAARSASIRHAKGTKKLDAKFGRASYVSKDEFKNFHTKSTGGSGGDDADNLEVDDDDESGIPDPGAIGLAALFDGAINGYFNFKT